MNDSSGRETPRRKDARRNKETLLDAAAAVFVAKGVEAPVRDIAAEAGVNHGLVHRHFGSKEGLIRAAVVRAAALVYSDETPPRTTWFFERLREHPELAIMIARACLDGPSELLAAAAPPPALLARLAERLAPTLKELGVRAADAYVMNALWTSALLGWFVFRPMLVAGYQLPANADDALARTIGSVDALLDYAQRKRERH